jgi:hypothetical protein
MKNKKVQGCNQKSYRCTLKLYQAKKKKKTNMQPTIQTIIKDLKQSN